MPPAVRQIKEARTGFVKIKDAPVRMAEKVGDGEDVFRPQPINAVPVVPSTEEHSGRSEQ